MRWKYLLLLILFTCAKTFAQVNLVRNGGFEQYATCPDNLDEIKYVRWWMSLDSAWTPPDWTHATWGVPQYCNVCAGSISYCGVPYNGDYYQYPRTGEGMAHVQMFYNESIPSYPQERDYLQGHLIKTLDAETAYCVSFYVSLGDASYFAVKDIGAFFDDGTIDTTHNPGLVQSQYTPQVSSSSIIADTMHWTRIQGTFVANGNERLITIGHFKKRVSSTYLTIRDTTGAVMGADFYSHYIVDDVSVLRSDATADAGPNKVIPIGSPDSVWIGDSSGNYLPTYWYANGVQIDSNVSGLKVHPSVTTDYVMSLDVCGHITYDTVRVWVGPNVISATATVMQAEVYPNPATDEITVSAPTNCQLTIYDVLGTPVLLQRINHQISSIPIGCLPRGSYMVQLVDKQTGERAVKLLFKN